MNFQRLHNLTFNDIATLRMLFVATLILTMQLVASAKPNIIIILADDLGYADLGSYGCKDIPTPHIDQIAKNGVRFTQGYSSQPVCAPSRAGLMSGMYSQRFGFENNSGPEKFAAVSFGLPRNIPTLAEKLSSAGYSTGLIGKWHLGFKNEHHPNNRGFDYFYGFIGGSRSYFPHKSQNTDPLMKNGEIVSNEKEYLTDAFAREAVDFIRRNSTTSTGPAVGKTTAIGTLETAKRPFFLYLSFSAVHLPMESIPQYEKRFANIADPKRRTYAAMLSSMDDAVGQVMSTLRKQGQENDTLVFFYSDNGGPTPYTTSSNKPLRGTKGDVYEGGIRVPFLMQWPAKLKGGRTYDEPVIAFDCHATALAAATISDASLDGVDLIPYLTYNEDKTPHENLCWRFNDRKAIRAGDWKLVYSTKGAAGELYNISNDIGEQKNLAREDPKKVKELSHKLTAWETQMEPPAWQSSEKRK